MIYDATRKNVSDKRFLALAAIEVGKRLGPGRRVVTLMVDSGLKYLNTDVYGRR